MSHQTGIRANEQLRNFFGKCRSGDVRVIKVAIQDEELTLDEYGEQNGDWEEDYDGLVLSLLEDAQPCFILYRLDTKDESGYKWLFIAWSPDNSPVREKMLYASTKATLKKEFGGGQISDEIFGTVADDVSLSGFKKQRESKGYAAPLTFAEEELQKIRKEVNSCDIGIDSKDQTVHGVPFEISQKVIAALYDMLETKVNYVQLSIDLAKEKIMLEGTPPTETSELSRRVPKDHGRYHLFRFPHTHEGDYQESIFFIFSMPDSDCPVKERMLYASCKRSVVDLIENKIGIPVAKRIEISDGRELTKEFLLNELHPPVNIHRMKFDKPKGPPNRGARRITKGKASQPDLGTGIVV